MVKQPEMIFKEESAGDGGNQSIQLMLNLLLQLKSCHHKDNAFIQNHTAMRRQIFNQLESQFQQVQTKGLIHTRSMNKIRDLLRTTKQNNNLQSVDGAIQEIEKQLKKNGNHIELNQYMDKHIQRDENNSRNIGYVSQNIHSKLDFHGTEYKNQDGIRRNAFGSPKAFNRRVEILWERFIQVYIKAFFMGESNRWKTSSQNYQRLVQNQRISKDRKALSQFLGRHDWNTIAFFRYGVIQNQWNLGKESIFQRIYTHTASNFGKDLFPPMNLEKVWEDKKNQDASISRELVSTAEKAFKVFHQQIQVLKKVSMFVQRNRGLSHYEKVTINQPINQERQNYSFQQSQTIQNKNDGITRNQETGWWEEFSQKNQSHYDYALNEKINQFGSWYFIRLINALNYGEILRRQWTHILEEQKDRRGFFINNLDKGSPKLSKIESTIAVLWENGYIRDKTAEKLKNRGEISRFFHMRRFTQFRSAFEELLPKVESNHNLFPIHNKNIPDKKIGRSSRNFYETVVKIAAMLVDLNFQENKIQESMNWVSQVEKSWKPAENTILYPIKQRSLSHQNEMYENQGIFSEKKKDSLLNRLIYFATLAIHPQELAEQAQNSIIKNITYFHSRAGRAHQTFLLHDPRKVEMAQRAEYERSILNMPRTDVSREFQKNRNMRGNKILKSWVERIAVGFSLQKFNTVLQEQVHKRQNDILQTPKHKKILTGETFFSFTGREMEGKEGEMNSINALMEKTISLQRSRKYIFFHKRNTTEFVEALKKRNKVLVNEKSEEDRLLSHSSSSITEGTKDRMYTMHGQHEEEKMMMVYRVEQPQESKSFPAEDPKAGYPEQMQNERKNNKEPKRRFSDPIEDEQPQINMENLYEKVYEKIEKRLRSERRRRGL